MDRRTVVALSLAALGTSAAFVAAVSSVARADDAVTTRVIDQDVDLAGARALTVRSASADVHVRTTVARRQAQTAETGSNGPAAGGASAHVHAEVRGTADELASAVRISREGDRVTIALEERPHRGDLASVLSHTSWQSTSFEILVAADVDLTVRTASGNVTVDAPAHAVTVRTGSGNVRVNDPRAAVDTHTGSGNVVVRGAASSLQLGTGSGNVAAGLNAGWSGDAVRIDSGSGNVRLAVPPGFRAAVQTSTGSGSVTDSAHVVAAESPVVSLRSSSGNVRIVPNGG